MSYETSLTSLDTDFQNSSVTKNFSVGFNQAANCCKKNEVKRSSILEIFYVKEPSNLICGKHFGPKLKSQTVKLLGITESICCFYPYAKNQHHISILPWHIANLISRITLKIVSATFLLVCFLSLNKNTCQTRKMFFIHFKSSFRSPENQILEFYIFKFHEVIKCLKHKTRNTFHWITWEVNKVC